MTCSFWSCCSKNSVAVKESFDVVQHSPIIDPRSPRPFLDHNTSQLAKKNLSAQPTPPRQSKPIGHRRSGPNDVISISISAPSNIPITTNPLTKYGVPPVNIHPSVLHALGVVEHSTSIDHSTDHRTSLSTVNTQRFSSVIS